MASILARFKTIMEANLNALLDQAEDPVKMADQLERDLQDDFGKVKAETASVMAEEKRAKRAYDECLEQIEKMQSYAEKAVLGGNDADAKTFLTEKATLSARLEQLKQNWEQAKANAEKMRQMHDKLQQQMNQIAERKASIQAKANMVKAQQRMQQIGGSLRGTTDGLSAFDRLEEQMNRKLDEAEAMAELHQVQNDVSDLMAKYDAAPAQNNAVDDELAALKAKLGK